MPSLQPDRKRVAIIIPGGIGTGAGNHGVPVLEGQIKRLALELDITVFSLFRVNKDYRADGFKLISIAPSNYFARSLLLLFRFWHSHRQARFTVVHGYWTLPAGLLAVCLGKIFAIKSVVSVLGGDASALPEIQYGALRRKLPRRLVLWTLMAASEVMVLTSYLLKNLYGAGLKRREVKIVPWGVDTKLFEFAERKLRAPLQFLHIGNLNPVKDQATLLRAFKIINNKIPSHLTIIGEGGREYELKQLAASLRLDISVTFKAPVPYHVLPAIYHQSDFLLHTSLSEGQSEVVTEAMSTGVIVCGTDVGLLFHLPDACVTVPVKDYEGLARAVLKLLDDPGRMDLIRQRARLWTEEHNLAWTVERTKELY